MEPLTKLKKGLPTKKSFVFTGRFLLISICLFFGTGLLASQLTESVVSNNDVKTFSEDEVDKIIDDNDKKVKDLEKGVRELKEFKSNKNYYDKLKSYNSLKQYMTYDEVIAAFDGEKGEGTTENINNTKNKTFIWDLYTEEVICRFSYDVFKKEFVLTSFLKQKKPE
ncbi:MULTISPECIES: hypothetical protein [Bacillus]|uniref:hypothetical protein n=1 Tax=Bacillus TaxID=1386 RepID=UPI0001A18F0B|nr:hypothetical protein [Bacillus pseudomycoides]EEM13299.1 hypothetical protein bpmyx0001_59070 [Bacillus pseudomycoides DSM 12442]